jgi:DNA-binding Lrp family transcriptional regulator
LFDSLFSKFPTIVEAKQFFVLDEFGPGWSILIPEKHALPKMPNDRAAFTSVFAAQNPKELTNIDEIDERILLALSEDATKGITQVAAEVGIGYRNVMDRLQRMIKEGVINGFDTRGSITGLGFSQATVLLRIANIEKNEHRAREFLGSLRECSRYWRLLGTTQFRVNLYAKTTEEFDHTIKKIKTFFRSDLIDMESVDIIEQMKRVGFSAPLKLK